MTRATNVSRLPGALLCALLAACGGGSSPTTPGGNTGPSPATLTFSGTTRANGPGNCTGEAHAFEAPDGGIAITLNVTNPSESLTAQVCPNGRTYTPDECTLSRRVIQVGETLTASRRGGASQSLSLLPLTCGTTAPPSPLPITYTSTVRTGA